MNWTSRLISEQELSAYSAIPLTDLRSRVAPMIAEQLDTWPMLRNATAALSQVEYKELDVNGSHVQVQFNPARIVSTAAKVDAASIKARPCFLCPENLPAEEKGIAFGENYVILCNPFPVLKNHLVISHRQHTPQAIADKFGNFLDLTKAIGDEYFTLYNGPACGASAPDHHHFQACSRAAVPLFDEVENWPRNYQTQQEAFPFFTLADYRLNVLIARGTEKPKIAAWFAETLLALATIASDFLIEPMLNLAATYDAHGWTVYLFPRAKHRPACYFAEGAKQLTVSPAGIDLAGVLVVPQPEHFARITAHDVEKIYCEVTLKKYA